MKKVQNYIVSSKNYRDSIIIVGSNISYKKAERIAKMYLSDIANCLQIDGKNALMTSLMFGIRIWDTDTNVIM